MKIEHNGKIALLTCDNVCEIEALKKIRAEADRRILHGKAKDLKEISIEDVMLVPHPIFDKYKGKRINNFIFVKNKIKGIEVII